MGNTTNYRKRVRFLDQEIARSHRLVRLCELELETFGHLAGHVQQLIKWASFFVGKKYPIVKSYWRLLQGITEAFTVFGLHSTTSQQILEITKDQLKKGQVWTSNCIASATPKSEHLWEDTVQDLNHHIYSLYQHRNILHYILTCLALGQFERAKVSIDTLRFETRNLRK